MCIETFARKSLKTISDIQYFYLAPHFLWKHHLSLLFQKQQHWCLHHQILMIARLSIICKHPEVLCKTKNQQQYSLNVEPFCMWIVLWRKCKEMQSWSAPPPSGPQQQLLCLSAFTWSLKECVFNIEHSKSAELLKHTLLTYKAVCSYFNSESYILI